jgi:hypothetical protein
MPISKTQIDRLGDRLKGGSHTESDLRLLDDYRRSFGEAYEEVVLAIQQIGQVPREDEPNQHPQSSRNFVARASG